MQCNNASSSTTTMLCPPEVLKRILLHVTDRQDLAQCTRVNVTWRQVSIPFLYERLRITSRFSSDTNTSKTFLRNEYGRHVRHLYLDMSILEDPQAPHQLLRPLQVQRRTSSLRRKGFKLFPGSTSNAIVDPQRRSSLIEFPMVQPAAAAAAASTTATATAPHPPSPPQQHRQHICFTILAVLQSCARVETVELDFHDRTFNMSKNAVFVFSQWQPTTLKKLHLMHLTRLIITPHLKTLTHDRSYGCFHNSDLCTHFMGPGIGYKCVARDPLANNAPILDHLGFARLVASVVRCFVKLAKQFGIIDTGDYTDTISLCFVLSLTTPATTTTTPKKAVSS
ncbi:hypothetical protein BDB00DRAFT_788447 [Zychaea mexicana]|uniref:uncharacterized protein n=1 Tax=Zychaea mexicana TaxID=64656 RepID=UPI0022FE9E49|nr:uncharacterized protein BDB00DRAFT_788447 [Zychaea mexicana]KAI9492795.1 hypothetical protein BDB00DRAFT_788447 [Zychaea mexicana]